MKLFLQQKLDVLNESLSLALLVGLIMVNIVLNYLFLMEIYRPHNIDNSWSLSFPYNYWVKGVETDNQFPGDTGGTEHFRKTYAILYGLILSQLDWSLTSAQILSTLLVLGACFLWYKILSQMKFNRNCRTAFVVLFLYLEFSFSAATTTRPEALLLFFQGLGLLLFLRGYYFWTGLVLTIGLETAPIGLVNFVFVAAWILSKANFGFEPNKNRSQVTFRISLFSFLAGCGLGLIYYLVLHQDHLTNLFSYLFEQSQRAGWGVWKSYFFLSKYYRHLPELFILIISLFIFFSTKLYQTRPFILYVLALLFPLGFVRDNFFYISLIYPGLLLLIVASFDRLIKIQILLLFFLLLMVPQYAGVYLLNHWWNAKAYLKAVDSLTPRTNHLVIGSSNAWFAINDRLDFKTALYPKERIRSLNPAKIYLLEDFFLINYPTYADTLEYLDLRYNRIIMRKAGSGKLEIKLIRMELKKNGKSSSN